MRKILLVLLIIGLLIIPCEAKTPWKSKPPLGAQIDWGHPLAKGLVGCWLMNEGAGLIAKDLVANNNATSKNGANWVPSLKGYAFNFDGTDDYLTCGIVDGKVLDITGNKVTVSAIVKIGSTAWAERNIVRKDRGHYNLVQLDADEVRFEIYNGGYVSAKTTTSPLVLNNWYHLIGVYDGIAVSVYINGKFVISAAATGNLANTGTPETFNIGCRDNNGTPDLFFPGIIASVQVWNTALIPQQIRQLYADPYCFIKPPTVWSNFLTAVAAVRRLMLIQ